MCSFCRSTLVRDGDALRRIGISAELFDDHSPLQLGASGKRQGIAFTLVGRLQYAYEGGTWNEWHALFDNGRSAWLSEDNGAYVVAFDAPLPADAPALKDLQAGQRVMADGRVWDVASVTRTKLLAAQGELPRPPHLQGEFVVVDLRNSAGEVATLDGSDPSALGWSVGRSVALSELALTGLRESSEKTLGSRSLECPNCGTALQVKLASTQSITCHQCSTVVDVSAGVGGELRHYQQNNVGESGAEPLIPLGRTGKLGLGGEPADWQVVGYQERCDVPDSSEDETTFWREYLLYNQMQGFAFLVDSNEGWSWVKPITGAPKLSGDRAQWGGVEFQKKWAYGAKVTWVQGEFYWRVRRDERAQVTDYEGRGPKSGARLSRELTGNEVTWSAGETLSAEAVAEAFAIAPGSRNVFQRDVKPLAGKAGGAARVVILVIVLIIVMIMLDQCDGSSSSGSRTGGGSYGGWSSGGGGHK